MEVKTTLQKLTAKTLLIASLLAALAPIAHADFTCSILQNPEEAKGYIVTVIEEQFDEPTSNSDTIQ